MTADGALESCGELGPQRVGRAQRPRLPQRRVHGQRIGLRGRVGDHGHGAGVQPPVAGAGSEATAADPARNAIGRPDGGREGDPLHLPGGQRQALHGGDEVDSALGVHDGVDLVQDHGPQPAQEAAAGLGGEEDVEALRCRDQHLGRMAEHPAALRLGGVAGAAEDAHRLGRGSGRGEARLQLGEGLQEVAADIVAEGAERRDVEHPHLTPVPLPGEQPVQGPQEGGQGLAGSGGGGDQDVLARGDVGPRGGLDGGGRAQAGLEPGPGGGAEELEGVAGSLHEERR